MMNKQHLSVFAVIRELEELLDTIPEENVIERMSLETRLQTAREFLATLRQSCASNLSLPIFRYND